MMTPPATAPCQDGSARHNQEQQWKHSKSWHTKSKLDDERLLFIGLSQGIRVAKTHDEIAHIPSSPSLSNWTCNYQLRALRSCTVRPRTYEQHPRLSLKHELHTEYQLQYKVIKAHVLTENINSVINLWVYKWVLYQIHRHRSRWVGWAEVEQFRCQSLGRWKRQEDRLTIQAMKTPET